MLKLLPDHRIYRDSENVIVLSYWFGGFHIHFRKNPVIWEYLFTKRYLGGKDE